MTYALSLTQPPKSTRYFMVDDFAFHIASINEVHGEWYYPTPQILNPAGWFSVDPSNTVVGDFNGDGNQDIAVIWVVFPHVLERESKVFPEIFFGDGRGGFLPSELSISGLPPIRDHQLYRAVARDFNNDGADDLFVTSAGLIKRDPKVEGGFITDFEPLVYLRSLPEGRLKDASSAIEGQERGGLPLGYSFGHDMSAGDVNGDGLIDAFSGGVLFTGNNKGGFDNARELLPADV